NELHGSQVARQNLLDISWAPANTWYFNRHGGVLAGWDGITHAFVGKFARFGCLFGAFSDFRIDSSHGCSFLVEDETVEIVCEVGQGQFRLGPGDTDGADEQPELVLLMGEHMLDPGADR